MTTAKDLFERRKRRTRFKLAQVNTSRPRLSIFRSKNHIYAQIIDDRASRTLVAASTLEKKVKDTKDLSNIAAAEKVGQLIGERAVKAGVKEIIFDRGGYLYHGRVKALAEAARNAGLSF